MSKFRRGEKVPPNLRLPVAGLHRARLRGWLDKKSPGILKSWQRRFFIVHEGILFYYKSTTDPVPVGTLYLKDCVSISLIEQFEGESLQNAIDIKYEWRDFVIRTSSEDDCSQWLEVLTEEAQKGFSLLRVTQQALAVSAPSEVAADAPFQQPEAAGGGGTDALEADTEEERCLQQQKEAADEERKRREAEEQLRLQLAEEEKRRRRMARDAARENSMAQFSRVGLVLWRQSCTLKKFTLKGGKPHLRVFSLINNDSEIVWGPKRGKWTSTVSVSSVRFVSYLARTTTFSQQAESVGDRACCLSLVLADRTVDMEADTKEQCELLFLGMQSLLVKQLQAEGRRNYSRGELVMFRTMDSLRAKARKANCSISDMFSKMVADNAKPPPSTVS